MAEGSIWWEGKSVGDSNGSIYAAEYSAAEFSRLFAVLLGSDAATHGFVAPGYGSSLKVQENSPAALNVILKSGGCFIRGRLYENDADLTLAIATADGVNPRLDRILLRVSLSASVQVIRAVVKTGTPAATPSLPGLTNDATTLEIPLANVWVAALATSITNTEIHDERAFSPNLEGLTNAVHQDNLIINSEFMAFSTLSTIPAGPGAVRGPDHWINQGGVPTSYASATKPAQMSRGRAVRITASAADSGMVQSVYVKASTMYAFKVLVNVTAGDTAKIELFDGTNTITRIVRRTGAWIEELIYFETAGGATLVNVRLLGGANTDVVDFGQVILVEGFIAGPFRQIHETIMFEHPVGDTNWNATAKSSGITTLTTADFQTLILTGTRGVFLHMRGNDSGSGAGAAGFDIFHAVNSLQVLSSLQLTQEPNDVVRAMTGVVGCVHTGSLFRAQVVATGVGTFDATLRVVGILT